MTRKAKRRLRRAQQRAADQVALFGANPIVERILGTIKQTSKRQRRPTNDKVVKIGQCYR